jgi:CheY-like chemotaxis protein
MLNMLRSLVGEDVALEWRPGADVWPVYTDPSQVDQVLANLCVNGRDAIRGNGHIIVETANVEFEEDWCASNPGYLPGDFVRLTVSDDGHGMDKETLGNIFEPFFTTKAVGQGTGLGLATVYGIVRQNEGFINVYSEPGLGTTFRVYLPRYHGSQTETTMPTHVQEASQGNETVLVVDDEASIVDMTRMALESLGYTVLSASSAKEALTLAAGHSIDLLMTDVIMPDMNGRELAEQLSADHPGMVCLFMSGYTDNILAHKGILRDDVQLLQKPFTLGELSAAVRRVLG